MRSPPRRSPCRSPAPSAVRTPASTSAPTFASVAVMTPFTASAALEPASSTATRLIVDGCRRPARRRPLPPARSARPSRSLPARTPSASSHATVARSVQAAVMSPTKGPGMPRAPRERAQVARRDRRTGSLRDVHVHHVLRGVEIAANHGRREDRERQRGCAATPPPGRRRSRRPRSRATSPGQ